MESIFPTLRFIAAHPLSSRRPFRAFWRYGRWQIESRLRGEVEFQWIEGSKLIVRNGMTGATGNIYCGLHEFADMAFLLHLLRPDDVFVDAGANIGSYTVLASAVCHARTVAIEPDPGTMGSLRRNVEANDLSTRVALEEVALGSKAGRVRFTVGQDTMNRVATASDANTRVVEVRSLDEVLDSANPVLAKIDVEGYEAQVIEGASATLRNPSVLAVQLESVDDRVRTQLESLDFKQAAYDPFTRMLVVGAESKSGVSSFNTLFVRDVDTCRRRIATAPVRDILGHAV